MRLLLIHAVYLRHTLGAKKESKHSNTLSENPVLCVTPLSCLKITAMQKVKILKNLCQKIIMNVHVKYIKLST